MSDFADQGGIPEFPLIDALDREILMHRDAHFGGLFSIMIDYYRQHGKGENPDFSIERIESLAVMEKELGQNLAALFLDISEMEKVADARKAYKDLKAIYEVANPKSKLPELIADLILSDDEEAEQEIAAIIVQKEAALPALLNLLREEKWTDPLFPGYGHAPELAVKCLGLIGDKRAIISLFEALGQGDFFADEEILLALKHIGLPAKEFLLKVVKGKLYNEDNQRAAMALGAFRGDSDVIAVCFNLMKDPHVQQDYALFSYLALGCEGIELTPLRAEFMALAEKETLPHELRQELRTIIKCW
jgi:hypothetical protein